MLRPCHSNHRLLPVLRQPPTCRFSYALSPSQRRLPAPVSTFFTRHTVTQGMNAATSLTQAQRRTLASQKVNGSSHVTKRSAKTENHDEHHEEHNGEHHGHSHSLSGGHDHDHQHGTDAEKVIEALKGRGDPGSRITLIGLFSNVVLTATKGAAGWFLHSASLMADAGHSLSDLLGDFVTLFCWQLSRRARSDRYPYGFGKFETLGTTTVSLLLVGGALGIGFHSYYLLLEALHPVIQSLPPGAMAEVIQSAAAATETVASHAHGHAHVHTLDPNAAWFAAISVVAKEWLYRITKKVADDERSSVLRANAIHHRSDAWSSLVALVAILGSWAIPGLPLDPIGGLIVSFVILGQGLGLLRGAFRQLTDAGVSDNTRRSIIRQLDPLLEPSSSLRLSHLLSVRDVRAMRSGALMFVDLIAVLPADASMRDAYVVQEEIKRRLMSQRKEISEVRVKIVPDELPAER